MMLNAVDTPQSPQSPGAWPLKWNVWARTLLRDLGHDPRRLTDYEVGFILWELTPFSVGGMEDVEKALRALPLAPAAPTVPGAVPGATLTAPADCRVCNGFRDMLAKYQSSLYADTLKMVREDWNRHKAKAHTLEVALKSAERERQGRLPDA